jgi:hypothetical protein
MNNTLKNKKTKKINKNRNNTTKRNGGWKWWPFGRNKTKESREQKIKEQKEKELKLSDKDKISKDEQGFSEEQKKDEVINRAVKDYSKEKQNQRKTLEESPNGKIFLGLPSIEQIISWGKVYTLRDSSRRLTRIFGRPSKEEYIIIKIGSADYNRYPDRPYEKYKKIFQLLNENNVKTKSSNLKPYIRTLYEKANELKKDKKNNSKIDIYDNFIDIYEDFIKLLCTHSAITEYCLDYSEKTISECLNDNKNSRNDFSEKYKKTTIVKRDSIQTVNKSINKKKYLIVINNLRGLLYFDIDENIRENREIDKESDNLYKKFICKKFDIESPKAVSQKTPKSESPKSQKTPKSESPKSAEFKTPNSATAEEAEDK